MDAAKLRRLVLEEAIKASKEYAAKEAVRAALQELAASRVASGDIDDEADLADFWRTVEMAAKALSMAPLEAFKREQ